MFRGMDYSILTDRNYPAFSKLKMRRTRKHDLLELYLFLKMGQPRPLFAYFRSFQTQILQKKL